MKVISGSGLASAPSIASVTASTGVQAAIATAVRRASVFAERDVRGHISAYDFGVESYERVLLGAIRAGAPAAASFTQTVRESCRRGALTQADLTGALEQSEARSDLSLAELEGYIKKGGINGRATVSTCAALASDLSGMAWTGLVAERIAHWARGYLETASSIWVSPFRDAPPLRAWLSEMTIDCSDTVLGLRQAQDQISQLPDDPEALLELAAKRLRVPEELQELYFQTLLTEAVACLPDMPLQELLGLKRKPEEFLVHLLAIRASWELILFRDYEMEGAELAWRRIVNAAKRSGDSCSPQGPERLFLKAHAAHEHSSQRRIAALIRAAGRQAPDREVGAIDAGARRAGVSGDGTHPIAAPEEDFTHNTVVAPADLANALPGTVSVSTYDARSDKEFGELEALMLDAAQRSAREIIGKPLSARTSLYVFAPVTAMNRIIESHAFLRDLVDNGWLNLFAVYDAGSVIVRYDGDLHWAPATVQDVA